MKRSAKTIGTRTKRAKRGTRQRERTPSLSLPSHPLGSLGSLIFLALSILFFAFYPTKEPGPRLREELNRKEIEATYAAAKNNPEKKFRFIQGSNILPMQLECCTSISQWFKSCTSQNYFRLSFVASVPAKIIFPFKIILISTCSLHLWVICHVASSKSFGRKQIYCYCHKTSK